MVQWLRLHSPNAGGQGSIPHQGTRSHTPQVKILNATTKIRRSQINKYFSIKKLSQQHLTSEETFILKSLLNLSKGSDSSWHLNHTHFALHPGGE